MKDTLLNTALPDDWSRHLGSEFERPYMQELKAFLMQQKQQGKVIYPSNRDIFAAFRHTPLAKVRVLILGQDPYHGPGQAHGLAFSVPQGIRPPPSLKNILKEIEQSVGGSCLPEGSGHLLPWSQQGVLLLNSVLTVEANKAASHQKKGWEQFTDRVIEIINQQCTGIVFMLWGNYAQKKGSKIDRDRHLVLETVHPSPLSAYQGFLGCGHFKLANRYLVEQGKASIQW